MASKEEEAPNLGPMIELGVTSMGSSSPGIASSAEMDDESGRLRARGGGEACGRVVDEVDDAV